MNKTDAANYLGIRVRSLECHTSHQRIAAQRVKGRTGLTLDYAPEELERFKAELETSPPVSPPPPLLPPTRPFELYTERSVYIVLTVYTVYNDSESDHGL